MLQGALDGVHGLPRARLDALAARFGAVQAEVRGRRAAGEYGFYKLVDQAGQVREITRFAEGVGQAYDHVLVLGIGGSALGARALLTALRRPAWNEWDDEGREFFPRLTVLDNVDPTTVRAALRRIDPRRVLVNVISKSGGTAETMAQYLVVRAWLEEALGGAAHRHLVFTTDPTRGALREIASRRSACRRTSVAGSACSRRSGFCPRPWSAWTSPRCWPAPPARSRAPRRTTFARIPRHYTPPCTGRP